MDNNENKRFEDYSDPRVTNLNGQPYHSASENDGKCRESGIRWSKL